MSDKKEKAPEPMSQEIMDKFDDFDCRPESHAGKAISYVPKHVQDRIKKKNDNSR